ncbi:peptide ABC transporter ATP-binding protein [Rhizobium yanglingense]|nr:peptide ABC transporter ATP-binding protein [Rhizobium yanglingense]
MRTHFRGERGPVRAVENVSFTLKSGETIAIVGESGSGKSVTSLSIMRLLASGRARSSGRIEFLGRDILSLSEAEMRKIRGNEIGMIFQEPMTSLNPVLTIGRQIAETLILHQHLSRAQARARAIEMLRLVDIPAAEQRIDEYPHQLSGGMRQRVMIAMALACEPKLLIADEPTTALDVTIQAQVLELMADLQKRTGTAIILITHDLGVVADVADRVIVMYAGRTVEEATTEDLFRHPLHPYTRGLLATIAKLGSSLDDNAPSRLTEIPGQVPSLHESIPGCAFASRCPLVTDLCRQTAPVFEAVEPDHKVACHHVERRLQA